MKFMLCEGIRAEEIENLKSNYKANIKFDGERVMAIVKNNEVFMINRRERIINSNFPEIEAELKKLEDCILDCEVISFDDCFNKIQRRAGTKNKDKIKQLIKEIPCKLMVFDILQYKEDLTGKPLKERINVLNMLDFSGFQFLEKAVYDDIYNLLIIAREEGREGIIIKNMASLYEFKRSKSWLKLKFFKETELRVIQYVENNKGIRAEDKEKNAVQIAGHKSQIVKKQIDNQGYCDIFIQYLEKTKENRFRFPSFRGVK